ncbi:hypothetical protein [Rhizorhabdus sp.]|uniref:hypothetical protein n=1 Tax=Rhizorhabdus sp. TaxID=1968843 RepID=UPI0035B29BEA
MGIADIRPQDAPDMRPANDADRERQPDELTLPAGCPVTALGRLGMTSFYLDEARQMIRMSTKDWNDVGILTLFGRRAQFLNDHWPKWSKETKNKPSEIVGFDYAEVKRALIEAASFAGIFDPEGRVRERGAHKGPDGELILHCGDAVLVGGLARINGERRDAQWRSPNLIEGYVYPTKPSIPKPWPDPADSSVADKTLKLLKTWNWVRPEIDPHLLLGQIGAMCVAGALDWRPHSWITGSKGTGKSTLNGEHGLLSMIFGDGVIRTSDATEAGLRQITKLQTLPIMFDEIEPEEQNNKNNAVISLARRASSGSKIHRGSQDHNAAEFTAQTCFLFSSILIPPMLTQDRSRLTFLELKELKRGGEPFKLDPAVWREVGRKLRRRMVDQWSRYSATLEAYQIALAAEGHSQRAQDQYGNLLACADLLLFDSAEGLTEDGFDPDLDEYVPSRIQYWSSRLRFTTLAEAMDDVADEDECAKHLGASYLRAKGGEDLKTVARVIRDAMMTSATADGHPIAIRARSRLSAVGMRVVHLVDKGEDENGTKKWGTTPAVSGKDVYVAIGGKRIIGLRQLFEKTVWQDGVWTQSLGRIKGAVKRVKVKFDGLSDWAVLVPVEAICSLETDDEDAPHLPDQEEM